MYNNAELDQEVSALPWECSMNIVLVVAAILIGIPLVFFAFCGVFACIRSSQISRDEERDEAKQISKDA
jgi:hypothetical protein